MQQYLKPDLVSSPITQFGFVKAGYTNVGPPQPSVLLCQFPLFIARVSLQNITLTSMHFVQNSFFDSMDSDGSHLEKSWVGYKMSLSTFCFNFLFFGYV